MKIIGILIFVVILFLTSCLVPPSKPKRVVFKSDPCIIPYSRYKFKTCNKMHMMVNSEPVTVPAGFITDLASIPRPLWSILSPRYSLFIAPAIFHDYLYQCPHIFTRKEADEIFYFALLANGVTRFTSFKFFVAVRIFGWIVYKNKACNGH